MQTLQSMNDIMNVIFDPTIEGLSLLDFVLVEENDKKFLGQVIEVKSDKYEADKNVATLKILYGINVFDEIIEYNGYTPTRDATIELYNQKEIEEFLNEGKTKFNAGLNPKTMLPLDFNLEFFKNSPVILADKLDELHTFYMNMAEKLAKNSNVIIFDYSGNLFIEDSLRLRAGVDFRLPLNYSTLSYIWDIALSNASIETQAFLEDIFNEVKLYSKTAEGGFIRFKDFTTVIEAQYMDTPIPELRVLKNRLNKYQQYKIFAEEEDELEILPKSSREEGIIILDFSYIDSIWQRAYTEYILTTLKSKSFLFLRLNEDNCNQAIIEEIYNNKTDLKVIPSFSYGFKKLQSVIDYAKNFIFLPTMNTTHNFSYVNNIISALTRNYAALFGEDTRGLIFKIQNKAPQINRYETEENKALRKVKLKGLKKYSNQTEEEEEVSQYVFDKNDEIANEVLNKEEAEIEPPLKPKDDENIMSIMEELNNNNPSGKSVVSNPINQAPIQPIDQKPKKESLIDEDELDMFDKIIEEENKEPKAEEKNDFVEIDYEENQKEIEDKLNLIEQTNEAPSKDIATSPLQNEEIQATPEEINAPKRTLIPDITKPIVNSKIEINENLTLDLAQIEKQLEGEEEEVEKKIPVFDEEESEVQAYGNFKENDVVRHEKYGAGKITKVINYSNRCLLQVEFDEYGKRLLDPNIANLTLMSR